ncbi:MAG TPA: four helix bundle protein [Anaerolineae bacterium]|nr:four helix bundle protein [Anaerolineae bacterium]
MMERPTSFEEWERAVPEAIRGDSLWKMKAYRLALFLSDLGWYDVLKLMDNHCLRELADQLYRSLGSIGANLAEGYSRGTGRDRARFYEYALGSARESRDWYYKGRHILGEAVLHHRLALLSEVIRLLLTMVPQQRGSVLREPPITYQTGSDTSLSDSLTNDAHLSALLHTIPY